MGFVEVQVWVWPTSEEEEKKKLVYYTMNGFNTNSRRVVIATPYFYLHTPLIFIRQSFKKNISKLLTQSTIEKTILNNSTKESFSKTYRLIGFFGNLLFLCHFQLKIPLKQKMLKKISFAELFKIIYVFQQTAWTLIFIRPFFIFLKP